MRMVFLVSTVLFLIFVSVTLAYPQEPLKIAVIDIKRVVNTSKYGQEVMESLQKRYDELQAKLNSKAKELDTLKEEIEKKSSLWSQEVREKKQNEFQKKLREFRTLQEDYQLEMQDLEKKLLDPVFKELEGIIKNYVEKEKIDLVLEKGQPGIYYASPRIDISVKIVEIFDQHYDLSKGKKEVQTKPTETKTKPKTK